jgi:hypothetical protein
MAPQIEDKDKTMTNNIYIWPPKNNPLDIKAEKTADSVRYTARYNGRPFASLLVGSGNYVSFRPDDHHDVAPYVLKENYRETLADLAKNLAQLIKSDQIPQLVVEPFRNAVNNEFADVLGISRRNPCHVLRFRTPSLGAS